MELKRYVKVENGMVYDITKTEFGIDEQYNCLYFWAKNMSGYLGTRAKVGMGFDGTLHRFTKIAATADDVWELVKKGWLALPDMWEHPRVIFGIEESVGGGYYIELYGTDEAFYNADGDILSLYCPITENGKIVRYELVWEREKGE
jgi:hypothetical protein